MSIEVGEFTFDPVPFKKDRWTAHINGRVFRLRFRDGDYDLTVSGKGLFHHGEEGTWLTGFSLDELARAIRSLLK